MVIWAIPALGLLVALVPDRAATNSERLVDGAFTPPWEFTLENYQYVLGRPASTRLHQQLRRSPSRRRSSSVMIAAFAAYAFAWMSSRAANILFVIVVGLLVVPLQVTFMPVLQPVPRLHAGRHQDQRHVPRACGWRTRATACRSRSTCYATTSGGCPREVFESAAIDGAGPSTAFFRLALPMSVPALASLVIFQFLWVWNDLLVALVYLGPVPQNHPLSVMLANLDDLARWRLAVPHRGGIRVDGRPDHRVPRPPAVLRPRHHRRRGQGLTPDRPRSGLGGSSRRAALLCASAQAAVLPAAAPGRGQPRTRSCSTPHPRVRRRTRASGHPGPHGGC